MGNTRPEGLLNTPALNKPTRDSLKTSPRFVDAWIAELPKADMGQFAKRLYDNLQQINSLDIPKKERIYILAALRKHVNHVSASLKRHFTNDSIPLSPKYWSIAELIISLNVEMAIAYKIIIEQSWTRKLSVLNKKSTAELLYWATHYLGEILLTTYQIYVEHPANTWVDLHQFYLYAEENKLELINVKDSDDISISSENTIADRYKQLLLLGLISPHRLRQTIIDKVYQALNHWCQYTTLHPADSYKPKQQHILIRQNSDSAPGFYLSDKAYNRVYTRVLDTAPLIHLIGEQIMHQAAAINDIRMIEIPDDVMHLLLTTWSGKSKRIYARSVAENQLNVTVGLRATHYLIQSLTKDNEPKEEAEERKPEPRPEPLRLAETLELGNAFQPQDQPTELALVDVADNNQSVFDASIVALDAPDVWNPTFADKPVGYDSNIREWLDRKKKENVAEPEHPPPYSCENVNESAGGYCLLASLRYDSNAARIQIGDITGIHTSMNRNPSAIGIGIIRRIKITDTTITIGIHKLASCANAIEVCAHYAQGPQRKFYRNLILPAIKTIDQPVTLLTHNKYKVGRELIIKKNRHQTLVKLTKQIENTGVISQFQFDVVKDLGTDSSPTETPNTEKFESVWSLI